MPHHRQIKKVAVIGAGTMGAGIAALCAQADIPVVLLDITKESADKAVERMLLGRFPAIEEPQKAELITTGELQEGLPLLKMCDWICEAVVEDLAVKRDTFKIIEAHRKEGSIVSTNTSGIPLRDIDRGLPERLRQDILVTHFFNPVKQMRLVELIPGSKTKPEVIEAMGEFCGQLGKGAVYAKDTVNFIEKPPAEDVLIVKVEGLQFAWSFTYPNGHKTVNELVVPANKVIVLEATARDVFHNFYVPDFKLMTDAIPGQTNVVWFKAVQPGSYQAHCNEICGVSHTFMKAIVTVKDPNDFEKWYAEYAGGT